MQTFISASRLRVVCAALLFIGCASPCDAASRSQNAPVIVPVWSERGENIGTISIQVPAEVTWSMTKPGESFWLFTFTSRGRSILKAYVGNFPPFPSKRIKAGVITCHFVGLEGSEVAGTNPDGSRSREVLLRIQRSGLPSFIYYMYFGLDRRTSMLSDEIILRTRLQTRAPSDPASKPKTEIPAK